jgi:pimeloyl-ACP methyl ester carboxylesterase
VTAADAAVIEQANPRATVVKVADSGHMIPWDNLDQTVAEIVRFVGRL